MLSREENYQIALEKAAGYEGVLKSKVTGEVFPTTRRLWSKAKGVLQNPKPTPGFLEQKAKHEARRVSKAARSASPTTHKVLKDGEWWVIDSSTGKLLKRASARDWIEKRALVQSSLIGGSIGAAAGYGSSKGKSKKERRRAALRGAALGAAIGGGGAAASGLGRIGAEDLVHRTAMMGPKNAVRLNNAIYYAGLGRYPAAAYVGSRPSKKKKSKTPAIRKQANMAGGGYPGSTGFGGSPGRNMTNAMNASANKAKLAPAPSGGMPMGGGNTRMMAEGAIVKKRTNAVIGEAGEEAVVPKKKVSKKTWEELKRKLPKEDERRPLKDKERDDTEKKAGARSNATLLALLLGSPTTAAKGTITKQVQRGRRVVTPAEIRKQIEIFLSRRAPRAQ